MNTLMLQARPDMLGAATVGPNESVEFQLLFWPSTTSNTQTALLEFRSNDIGSINYKVNGHGMWPQAGNNGGVGNNNSLAGQGSARKEIRMPEMVIRGTKGKTVSGTIIFTNPFSESIHVSPSLREKTSNKKHTREAVMGLAVEEKEHGAAPSVFQLLLPTSSRKSFAVVGQPGAASGVATSASLPERAMTMSSSASGMILGGGFMSALMSPGSIGIGNSATSRIPVPAYDKVELPFTFHPSSMESQSMELLVESITQNIRWVYPVLGVTEVTIHHNVSTLIIASAGAGSMASLKDHTGGGNGGGGGSSSNRAANKSKVGKAPFLGRGTASVFEARIGETIHVQVDVPLLGFLSARKHAGHAVSHADGQSQSAGTRRASFSHSLSSNSGNNHNNSKSQPVIQVHIEYAHHSPATTTSMHHSPTISLPATVSGKNSGLFHSSSLGNLGVGGPTMASTESLSNLSLSDEVFKVSFQHLMFPGLQHGDEPATTTAATGANAATTTTPTMTGKHNNATNNTLITTTTTSTITADGSLGLPSTLGSPSSRPGSGANGGASGTLNGGAAANSPGPAGGANSSVVGRFRARFAPKRSVDLAAYLIITDEITKARWKVPLRIRAG